MSAASYQLNVTSDASAISAASAWVRSLGTRIELPPGDVFRLDICVTELVTNIASYGYKNGAGVIELRAEAANGGGIRVEVIDGGLPFDPLSAPSPEGADPPGHARIGGLGIHLVRNFSDDCSYDRRDGRNVFTLTINRSIDVPTAGGAKDRGSERRRDPGPATFPLTRSNGTMVTVEERRGRDRRVLGFISSCEMFRNVPYRQLEEVLAKCPTRSFPDGTVLLRPGERNEHVALVLQGRLRIQLGSPDSADYTEIKVGECVGEMSVIDGKPVSAFVIADSGCRLILVDKATFLTRILTIPEVARNLVATFSERMRRSNDKTIERMKSSLELEALQRELQFAYEVQTSMVPARMALSPEPPVVQCSGYVRPARQVGGDFYDAFHIDVNRLVVLIGDVCGKGMPAALFMSRTMTLLRSEATHPVARAQRGHVLELVERTNRQLCEGNSAAYFSSFFVGLLDIPTGVLTYVNAGHCPPALARGSSDFRLVTEPRDVVAGLFEDAKYTVGETVLPPGSVLVLYTDGVTEAENARGEMYGQRRLLELLNDTGVRDPNPLIDLVVEVVEDFVQGHTQSDDLTLLVLRYDPYADSIR